MSIKYQTTRGAIKGASFQQALLSGFAPDGGLFVPESLPRFTRDEIRSWVGLSYPQLVEKLMRFFIAPEELSSQEIHGASEFSEEFLYSVGGAPRGWVGDSCC